MSNTKKFFVTIGLQIAAIIVMAFVIRSMGTKEVDIGFGEWASEYMAYDGVSYSLKGEYVDSGQGLTLFSQPGLYMPAGSYTMTVSYVSDEDQSISLSTPVAKQDRYISAGTVLLPKYIYDVTYDFELRLPVDEVNFDVKYGGSGNFTLNSVTIVQNHDRYVRYLAILAFLMILVDLYFFWFKRLESGKRGTVLVLLGIWLLSSLPLFFYGILHGDDLPFHLARIEALAQELRNGDIPARVGSLWLYGWGYPSSVLYGDYLLYLPALCRILHFNVVISYKVFVLFVNLLTVVIAYWSYKYIFEDRNDALLLTLAYSTAAYRLTISIQGKLWASLMH